MARLGSLTHSDEKSDVEIDSQAKDWLYVFLLTIRDLTDHPQNYSESHFMTVGFGKGSSTILIEADVRCAGTQHCHIGTSDR